MFIKFDIEEFYERPTKTCPSLFWLDSFSDDFS
jgi:hypothetical protein